MASTARRWFASYSCGDPATPAARSEIGWNVQACNATTVRPIASASDIAQRSAAALTADPSTPTTMSPCCAVVMTSPSPHSLRTSLRVQVAEPFVLPLPVPEAVEHEHGQPVESAQNEQHGEPQTDPDTRGVDRRAYRAAGWIHRVARLVQPDRDGVALDRAFLGVDLADAADAVGHCPCRVGGLRVADDAR